MTKRSQTKLNGGGARGKHGCNCLGLTTAQQLALRALLEGRNQADAARAARVGRCAVSYWVNHEPVFQAAFQRAQREVHSGFLNALKFEAAASLRHLAKVRDDPTADASDRLRAATTLLQHLPITPEMVMPQEQPSRERELMDLLSLEGHAEAATDRENHAKGALEAFDTSSRGQRLRRLLTEASIHCRRKAVLDAEIAQGEAALGPMGSQPEAGKIRASIKDCGKEVRNIVARLHQIEPELAELGGEREQLEEMAQLGPHDLVDLNNWRRQMLRLLGKDGFFDLVAKGEPTESMLRALRQAKEMADRENVGDQSAAAIEECSRPLVKLSSGVIDSSPDTQKEN